MTATISIIVVRKNTAQIKMFKKKTKKKGSEFAGPTVLLK